MSCGARLEERAMTMRPASAMRATMLAVLASFAAAQVLHPERWAKALALQDAAVGDVPVAERGDAGWYSSLVLRGKTKKISDANVRFIFVMGVEGSGHHVWQQWFRSCSDSGTSEGKRAQVLCVEDATLSSLLFANGTSPTSLFFGGRHSLLASAFAHRLRTVRERLRASRKPTLVFLNCGTEHNGVGMVSYPNFGTHVSLQPDVRILSGLSEEAGVDLRVVVLLRPPACTVRSVERRFPEMGRTASRSTLERTAYSLQVMSQQLHEISPAFFRCTSNALLAKGDVGWLQGALHPRLDADETACLTSAADRVGCSGGEPLQGEHTAEVDSNFRELATVCDVDEPLSPPAKVAHVCVPPNPRFSFLINRMAMAGGDFDHASTSGASAVVNVPPQVRYRVLSLETTVASKAMLTPVPQGVTLVPPSAIATECDLVLQLWVPVFKSSNGSKIHPSFKLPSEHMLEHWPKSRTAKASCGLCCHPLPSGLTSLDPPPPVFSDPSGLTSLDPPPQVFSDENCGRKGVEPFQASDRSNSTLLMYPGAADDLNGPNAPVFLPLFMNSNMKSVSRAEALATPASERPFVFNLVASKTRSGRQIWFNYARAWLKGSCGFVYETTKWVAHDSSRSMAGAVQMECSSGPHAPQGIYIGSATPLSYADSRSVLLKSKFTLQPAGNAAECFRWYEAAAAGSIPILGLHEVKSRFPPCASAPLLGALQFPFVVINLDKMEEFMRRQGANATWVDERSRAARDWFERITERAALDVDQRLARMASGADEVEARGTERAACGEASLPAQTHRSKRTSIDRPPSADASPLREGGPSLARAPLVVQPRNGLGNRLRALASAMSVAAHVGRPLIVEWIPDAHCNISLRNLCQKPFPFALRDRPVHPEVDLSAALQVDYVMEAASGKTQQQLANMTTAFDDDKRVVHFISAFLMNHPFGNWKHARHHLRQLSPLPFVAKQVIATSSMVGMHVRSVFPFSQERPLTSTSVSAAKAANLEYGPTAIANLQKARKSSHWTAFATRAKALAALDNSTTFYLAADSEEAYRGLMAALPGRIVTNGQWQLDCNTPLDQRRRLTTRRCDSRDESAVRRAYIDLLNLGKTRLILGSNFSSFTEVASEIEDGTQLLAHKAADSRRWRNLVGVPVALAPDFRLQPHICANHKPFQIPDNEVATFCPMLASR